AEHDLASLPRILGPMHMPAASGDCAFELLQQRVEIRERVVADGAALLAQGFPIPVPRNRLRSAVREMRLEAAERGAEARIVERGVSRLAERSRIEVHGSPSAGSSAMPASTSATWRARMLMPLRCMRPLRCSRQ